MKKALFLLPILAVYIIVTLSSNTSGPAGASNDASGARGGAGCNNGSGCHGSASTTTTVTVTLDSAGYPINHYVAGNTYNITVKGTNTSSTSLPAFGFTVTAVRASGAGTAAATNIGTLATSGLPSGCVNRTIGGLNVVEHNGPIGPLSGSGGMGTTYGRSIPWTAPSTGSGAVIIYGVVNAINNNSASSGDRWNWHTDTLLEFFPSVLPIVGPTSVCEGSTVSLTSGSAGGTWSISNPSIASVSASGVVNGIRSGTAIVSYSAGSLGVDTAMITVNPLPVSGTVTGGTNVCVGGSFRLASSASGGSWSTTNAAVVSVNSTTGQIHGVANGTATIIYRVNNSCGSSYSYNAITVAAGVVSGTITGPASFCEGFASRVFRATGTGGGRWSTSTTSVASIDTLGNLYGISRGNAIITYSVSSSCGNTSVIDTFTILPSPPPIVGPATGCVGATIAFTDSVTGGIWRGTNPSVAAVAAGFGTVVGIAPGNDTIIYIAPTGCIARKALTIYPSPGAITGTTSACPGVTSVLSNPTPGGTWRTANATIASISSTGIVTAVSANTTTISYILPVGGCFSTTSFTTHPIPTFIQGMDAFCANATDSLFNLTPGGTWSSSPSSVAVVNSTTGLLTGVGGGTVSVTYTLPAGCFVTRPITVRPTPNPTITINFSTSSFLTENYFVNYQWYRDGTMLPGATTPMVGAPYNGVYTVFVTDTFGCTNTSAPYNFTQVGIENLSKGQSLKLYPNPSSELITIESAVPVNIRIYSVDGKLQMSADNRDKIDIRNLLPGNYLLKCYDNTGYELGQQQFQKQ